MDEPEIYISRVVTPEAKGDYVSLLPPKGDLIAETVIGVLRTPQSGDPVISTDTFTRNGVFVDFMHDVIRREAPKLPAYKTEARRVGNGPVYVIDQRAAEQQTPIQPEDVFGAFEASNGELVPGSYETNPTHKILSERGFFRLEAALRAALMRDLESLALEKKR